MSQIADASKELSKKAESIHQSAEAIEELATNTFDTVKVIKESARKSHILALNAAIEAARAGQNGKGFAIVANEMGMLAKASGDSAEEIGERVSVMLKELQEIAASLANIVQISGEQTESVASINAALDKIKAEAAQLAKAAKIS